MTILFLEPKGTALEVIREAKRQGYKVVALVCDPTMLSGTPLPYRTAIASIDKTVTLKSWSDWEALLAAAKTLNREDAVKGVYFSLDAAAVAGTRLRKHFKLPSPTPETMALVLDKYRLRHALREKGLSSLMSYRGEEADAWTSWKLKGEAYFKPVNGSFSAFVEKCASLEDLHRARKAWSSMGAETPAMLRDYIGAGNGYLVEEAFDGELMSLEGICVNGEYKALGLTSRILYSKNPVVEMGSVFPYPHKLAAKIQEFVQRVHEAVGFTEGPSHVELMVDASGHMEIIDFNARFIGADVMQSINFALGIKIQEALLDFAVGKAPKLVYEQKKFACLQYALPPQALEVKTLEFPKGDDVVFHTAYIEAGQKVESTERQIDYLGCYLTLGDSFEDALARSHAHREGLILNGKLKGSF